MCFIDRHGKGTAAWAVHRDGNHAAVARFAVSPGVSRTQTVQPAKARSLIAATRSSAVRARPVIADLRVSRRQRRRVQVETHPRAMGNARSACAASRWPA